MASTSIEIEVESKVNKIDVQRGKRPPLGSQRIMRISLSSKSKLLISKIESKLSADAGEPEF